MLKQLFSLLPRSTKTKIMFYYKEIPNTLDIPINIKLKMWRKGFKARNYYYMDIKNKGTKYYVSELFNYTTHPKNGIYSGLINNKLYLPYCLKNYPEHVPDYLYLIDKDHVYRLFGDHKVYKKNKDDFCNMFLGKDKKQVGKILGKSGGEGILFFEKVSNNDIKINNNQMNMEKGFNIFKNTNQMIFMRFIEPHSYSKRLNPNTVNGIRITTGWDVDKHEPFILYGIHKVGRPNMYGADNGALGGICSAIDIENGIIGKTGIRHSKRVEFVDNHPDTGVQIKGVRIPHYDQIKRTILQISRDLNFLKYIGWDIVVTDDSFVILEMNSNPELWASQMYKQILKDERIKKFYEQFVTKKTEKYFMK